MNSQLYSYVPGNLSHLGCLNAGLLTGQSKITGRANARHAPIWDYYNEVVHNAVNPFRAHQRFMHYHRAEIMALTGRGQYNLFLPFERGGLGFLPIPGWMPKVTSFQRRFAEFLERKFLSDPMCMPKIALVSGKNQSRLVLYHQPRITVGAKTGPQPQDCLPFYEREVSLPPLALAGEDPERAELRVRLPRPRTIREFRTGTFKRMGGEVMSFPWMPYEVSLRRFPGEDQEVYLHRLGHCSFERATIGWYDSLVWQVQGHSIDCSCWTCRTLELYRLHH